MQAAEFGMTGMGHDRFKKILSAQICSKQLSSHHSNLISEQYLLMLFDDHVANLNKNHSRKYHTPDSICVDESMSRWYGIGGHCINSGLPQYISTDRNP